MQPINAPPITGNRPIESSRRKILRFIVCIFTFYSAFMAAHAMLMTGQILQNQIRAGVIREMHSQKGGYLLKLDTGDEVHFPDYVLAQRWPWIKLNVGDRVEKESDSPEYFINGLAVTNREWLLREFVFPVPLLVMVGGYILFGGIYAIRYRHAALVDVVRGKSRDIPPPTLRRLIYALASTMAIWIASVLAEAAVFGCIMSTLSLLARIVLRR